MDKRLEPMKCGNCGKRRVTLRARGSGASLTEVRIRCVACKSVTVLRVGQPTIEVGWGKDAKGIMCIGWRR